MSKPSIGFVGLGAMGFGMATHLVKAGYKVHGYDVFPASVERFAAAGGIPAWSARESAENKQFYICMVASAPQAQEVLFGEGGVVEYLPTNATLIITSTVPAYYVQSVANELIARNRSDILLVDSPVSGGTFRAADGTLSLMSGGSPEAIDSAREILQELSDEKKLYLVPGGVGAGSNMKMLHQVLAAIHILAASEVMGFAARLGLNARETEERLRGGKGWTWMLENRFPRMVEEDWNPGASALTIILKDAGIITTSARQAHFPTPLSSTAEQVYLAALSQGYASKDDSAMVRQYFPTPIADVSSPADIDTESAYQIVLDLALGINLVAAAEAVGFALHLQTDFPQFYDLVSNAAGGSRVFNEHANEMRDGLGENGTTGETLDEAISKLERVVQRARDMHVPLHLGNAALSVLLLARRRLDGGVVSTGVVRVFS